jgi:hypothetical protein
MNHEQPDPLLAALGALERTQLDPAASARALGLAEGALAAATSPRGRRWLGVDVLLPAVLCLGGLLYAGGALLDLARVYGPAPVPGLATGSPEQAQEQLALLLRVPP